MLTRRVQPGRGRNRERDPRGTPSKRCGSKDRTESSSSRRPLLFLLTVSVVGLLGVYLWQHDSVVSPDRLHSSVRSRLQANNGNECSIYMARSSLKGHVGFGIFTTKDIKKDELILHGSEGPSIPVVDYWNGPHKESTEQWVGVWDNYWWGRGVSDDVNFEARTVIDFQLGFGTLPNHHCVLDSLDHRYPTPAYDDSLVNRFKDPGTGAFSYSMGRSFFVTRDVQAGDELFLNYGHCKRHSDEEDPNDWTTMIPMKEDYKAAAEIAWDFLQSKKKLRSDAKITAPEDANKYVSSLLPSPIFKLRDMTAGKKIKDVKDLIPLIARNVASTPRTPEWIRSNGICLENLVPGKSTIPQAGQGGFTQHHIQKGEIVVPVPMLQIPEMEVLAMYNDDGGRAHGWQLLLNYCFGHRESSLLLCPGTNALLINHCSTRKKECGSKGPNAEYRWSSGWEPSSEEWRKMSVDEIAKQPGRGVSMEIVALRDIEPGEEVFIDYGVEWEAAWEEHVMSWKPPVQDTKPFITAKEANKQKSPLKLLATGDLRKVSNDEHLFTGCHFWPLPGIEQREVWKQEDPSWVDRTDEEILERYGEDGSEYETSDPNYYEDRAHWPCSVLKDEGNDKYTVRIHGASWERKKNWDKNDLPRLLTNYPRESIRYFVKPYESDQRLSGVFRHPIVIRDEIFPEEWKNRKNV